MTVPSSRSADLWAGIACIGLGGLALWVSADYPLGNAGRLGPGYVPRLLAWLLIGLGSIMVLRSFIKREQMEPGFAVRPVALVLASVLTFAAAFNWFGLVPAILATVAVSNAAVAANSWRSAIAVGAALALFAWLLFVKALGLPLPVFLS